MSSMWGSTMPCSMCGNASNTRAFECEVVGCKVTHLCQSCANDSRCWVCEHDYCPEHRSSCDQCHQTTCAYCTRRLYGQKQKLDLNCFDQLTTSIVATDVVAYCPLAATLPPPDDSIFSCFDPPIELITYSRSKRAAANGSRPDDVQAEHFVPNSCFIVGTGRRGATIAGAGKYSEGQALTYWVGDDQKAGTEHKYLTDRERAFCDLQENAGQYPTLEAWLQFMQEVTTESILRHRTYVGDLTGCTTQTETDNRIQVAAAKAGHAIRYRMQEHYTRTLKCKLEAPLGNGITGGQAPDPYVSKSQIFNFPK